MEGAVSIGAVCLVDRTVSGANQVFIHRTDRKKQLVKKRFASPSISSPIELSGLKTAMKLAEFFDASLAEPREFAADLCNRVAVIWFRAHL